MNLTPFNRCVHLLYWSHAQTQANKSQQKCGFNVVFLISHQDKIHFFLKCILHIHYFVFFFH